MELYHLINRGIDGRKIFIDDPDRIRFVHDLYEFNDENPANEYRRIKISRLRDDMLHSHPRKRIVDIHGWKLMNNHTHLIVSERTENGLSLFTRKMSGYVRYFNERHKRRGHLFEKGTKKILIEDESHFLYILHYIHLNSLDAFPDAKGWRERDKRNITNITGALEHLRNDRWSSYRDYCGIKNFPSILTKKLFETEKYEDTVRAYLKDRQAEDPDLNILE